MANYTDILNAFAEYTNYNPEQTTFNLLSASYEFHKIGKTLETLVKDYDPTGLLSVLYAKHAFERMAKEYTYKVSVYDLLHQKDFWEEFARDKAMNEVFESPDVQAAEKSFFSHVNDLALRASGIKLIGKANPDDAMEEFFDNLNVVIDALGKYGADLYQAGGEIGKIDRFSTDILVFERMADCLLALEHAGDGIYLCFINQHGTDECYFAYVLKSNGTTIAVHDRRDEAYIGQHGHSRNDRWRIRSGNFPYEYVFNRLNDGKVDRLPFGDMPADIIQLQLLSMILLTKKFEGHSFSDRDPALLNTLMPENYLAEHGGTEIVPYKESGLAVYSRDYEPPFTNDGIISGEYGKQWSFSEEGKFWTDRYGDGFVYDAGTVLRSQDETALPGRNAGLTAEFIGDRNRMDKEAYRQLRAQLADYIRNRLMEEYDRFGGRRAVHNWWITECKKRKEILTAFACEYQYAQDNPSEENSGHDGGQEHGWGFASIYDNWAKKVTPMTSRMERSDTFPSSVRLLSGSDSCINVDILRGKLEDAYKDEENGCECKVFFVFRFRNWLEIKEFIGGDLPKIVEGWNGNGQICYNGNHLLSATDAVADIVSPLYGGERPDGGGEYIRVYFDIAVGFSKRRWNKIYHEYCKKKP